MSNRLTKTLCLLVGLFSLHANSFDLIKPKYEDSPLSANEFDQLKIKQAWTKNSMALKVHNGLKGTIFCSTVTIFQGQDKYTVKTQGGFISSNEIGIIEAELFDNSSKVTGYLLNCTCGRNKKTGICDSQI